jgi:hypothetical protein
MFWVMPAFALLGRAAPALSTPLYKNGLRNPSALNAIFIRSAYERAEKWGVVLYKNWFLAINNFVG